MAIQREDNPRMAATVPLVRFVDRMGGSCRRDFVAAPDPAARRVELEARLIELSSLFCTARAFAVEDIIDPWDTRPLLCGFVHIAQEFTRTQLGPKSRVGMRP